MKKSYALHKKKRIAQNKEYHKQRCKIDVVYKLKVEAAARLRRSGMSPEQYQEIFKAQGGKCAICNQFEITRNRSGSEVISLSVDHNHQTKQNRGLLCGSCNRALERLDTIPNWASKADAYIKKYKGVPIDD